MSDNREAVFYDLLNKYEILLGAQGWSDPEIQAELNKLSADFKANLSMKDDST
ncbi:hypothetical protein [Virgibacillus salexigens]|uniref:Uncharacterized protein n=1 Tax=Virgibacillus massiliensis TaxID=1462526 RepID=A0A024QHZ1_9BACI|nr:hypothetical protein [Virgibacillus massiliensis]CDQ41862.1 hypothetical protein BN990_04241 [Virgibacillus massiliensis]